MNWYHVCLAALMIGTGSINTLSEKWMYMHTSENRFGNETEFVHPFVNTHAMFAGEILCFVLYKILMKYYSSKEEGLEQQKILTMGNEDFNRFLLMAPTVCDMVATSLISIGLNLTYASSYQMFRGGVVIFTAILSMIFLERRLNWKEYSGLFLITCGLTLVGVSDFFSQEEEEGKSIYNIVIGDVLIFSAQIFSATQVVIEEKFVVQQDIAPLHAVGLEGFFGFIILGILLIPAYFIYVGKPLSYNPTGAIEDVVDAIIQLKNNFLLIIAICLMTFSIAFFNFAGISISKEISALTRVVLDNIRTILIWIISMSFLGQTFEWLQLGGFVLIAGGIFLYNYISEEQITE